MKIASISEIRETAGDVLRSSDPVLVTRRGRLAGVYFPAPQSSLPPEVKRELFNYLSAEIQQDLEARGVSEDEVLGDFASWRAERRAPRSGR